MFYDRPGMKLYAEILAIECVPVGEDITGELSSGMAVLRGSMMAASVRYQSKNSYPQKYCVAEGGYEAKVFPDYKFDVDDQSRVQDGDGVFCLQIADHEARDCE